MSPLALSLRFLQTQPDGRLVELSRAGHERAFEALVQRYRRQLLAYCRRITSSEASAEDALQQALLQAWMALSTSDVEVRDARAWLYRIVHNVAISNLRRAMPDAVEVDDAQRASGADHEVERRLAVREALAGLASLPELQRQVMLSTALEGRSHDEIATALGLSNGAVRGLIYRARATLRAAAAAVTPAPLVHWAVRQQAPGAGRSAGLVETIAAGGGSAGLGGVLLKGGALVVSAGAIATAAGVATTPSRHRAHHDAAVAAARHSGPSSSHAASAGAQVAVSVAGVRLASGTTSASHGRGAGSGHGRSGSRSGHGGGSGSGGHSAFFGGSSHDHSGSQGSGGGDGHGSGSGHGGGDGRHSGSGDSGRTSGTDGGSGGDHHSGHDGSRTGTATSGDGGSGGDHGGGGGGTLTSTTTATSTSGGSGDASGGGSGGDGGGDRSGTTTTVTTTSTTTSGSATSGD